MLKIVNGQVVRPGDDSAVASSSVSAISSVYTGTLPLAGSDYQKWQLLLTVCLAGLFFGVKGAFLTVCVIGGAYLYGNGPTNSGIGSSSAGMQRMSTRTGVGGPNIRGMSDLPPPPKSS